MKSAAILILLSALFLTASCESISGSNSTSDDAGKLIIPKTASKKLESPQQAQAKREQKEEAFNTQCTTANIYLTQSLTIFPIYNETKKFKVNGMKLKFDMYNAASIAAYHNLQFEVKFISKSGSIVKKGIYTINETIEPNRTMIHALETDITNRQYNAFTSTEVTLVGADCKKGKGQ